MSSFFRRTLGLSRDSPDVESTTPTPLPHHGDAMHSSSDRSDYVHNYPPPIPSSAQSNPVALPPSTPEQSYTVPYAGPHAGPHTLPAFASEHRIPPTTLRESPGAHGLQVEPHFAEHNRNQSMRPAQEQKLRREDRDDAAGPMHRLQRQTKTARPFYEEPVSTR